MGGSQQVIDHVMGLSASLLGGVGNSQAAKAAAVIPSPVLWAYVVFGLLLVIGLAVIALRGGWSNAKGWDKLLLLGPVFFAAPVAAFGTEHLTITPQIASLVPGWIPWHYFWTYLIGACFLAAGLSLVTGIQTRLAASLLALNFFLFVVLMDAPAWWQAPHNRFALALLLRELSFSAGPLALAASLGCSRKLDRAAVTAARYCLAVAVLYYSLEQLLHGSYVPGIPLNQVTPTAIVGHALWTYLAAAIYVVAGVLLLAGWFTRIAAACVGLTVLFLVLVVYVPFAVAQRTSLTGFNFLADTLMFGGAMLLLARALPPAALPQRAVPATAQMDTA